MGDTIKIHVLPDGRGNYPQTVRLPVILRGLSFISGKKRVEVSGHRFTKKIQIILRNSVGYCLFDYKPNVRGSPRLFTIQIDGKPCYTVKIFSQVPRNRPVMNFMPNLELMVKIGPPHQGTALNLPLLVSSTSEDRIAMKITVNGTGYSFSDEKRLPVVNGFSLPTFNLPNLIAGRVYRVKVEAGGEQQNHVLRVR